MSRLTRLTRQRASLGEIREIMNSIKTLAYLETRKLSRYRSAQAAVVENIENAAADLLRFHPQVLPRAPALSTVHLLFGSERGFCGDFNHALLKQMHRALDDDPSRRGVRTAPAVIAIGRRLHLLTDPEPYPASRIDGASVVEEVPAVLNSVVQALAAIQQERGALNVVCLYHRGEEGIAAETLLPPFKELRDRPPRGNHPPLLNQPPEEFFDGLTEHYLFAALHRAFYTSLTVENQRRIAHLEGAVRHLDEESEELARRCNALRQEEIINEIEVILLSAANLQERPDHDSMNRLTP